MRENETTKQVQGGHTSTDPGGILARSTGVITDLAGGRGVGMNEWKAKKVWLMTISLQELVLVDDPSEFVVVRRKK